MLRFFARARCVVAAAAVCASAGMALAQPDVIVSTVGGTLTKNGTVGNITGYSMTTVSCNIGTAEAIWLQNSADHPVIGQEMYRLMNGRFEQIGMSWLKHGFCAADAPNCTNLVPGSTYTPNNSCDWLGRFATDTYSASLNGQQSNLGPRSEVNPATGVYPYPYVLAAGATGNCIYKRLQIANDDLNPALNLNARYFAEVHYVTTDEPSGNRANNASYREVSVGALTNGPSGCTAQGYTLAFSGATVPMVPAIQAWKAVDPSVQLTNVDFGASGSIIIGAKVTDVGGGNYDYEYAVYNHNYEPAIGGFEIPKTASVNILSTGFHDINYHSGEPYSGTDWSASVSSGSISWATQTFAANPNANAIRWSTTYNFRFRANVAPTNGLLNITSFKTGAVTGVNNVLVPGIPAISGACCNGTACSVGLNTACSGVFQGANSACGPVGNPTTCCMANFDGVNGLDTNDIFSYLNAFFAGTAPDFNGGGLDVTDIFAYLNAWFAGC